MIYLKLIMIFATTLGICVNTFAFREGDQNKPNSQFAESESISNSAPLYPAELELKLTKVRESGNTLETEKLYKKINEYIPEENKFKTKIIPDLHFVEDTIQPPDPSWISPDKVVYSGFVNGGGGTPHYREIDMKMGEDGNIYIAVNRNPNPREISVYRSSNGGLNWISTGGVSSTTHYLTSVSLLVEKRDPVNNDSIRIFVFFNQSTVANNSNGNLSFYSWRRNGGGPYGGLIASPALGSQFNFPSAVSNGAFNDIATDIGVVCSRTNNSVVDAFSLVFYKSLDWGASWIGVSTSGIYNAFHTSAAFKPGTSFANDSVWVVCTYKDIDFGISFIHLLKMSWTSPAFNSPIDLSGCDASCLSERPVITIKQNRPCDSAMVTYTNEGKARYAFTTNGGGNWIRDINFGGIDNGGNKLFTYCASVPEGNEPFVAVWNSTDGDSLNVWKGALGTSGTISYKRNSSLTSFYLSPVCAVYTPDNIKSCAAVSYPGRPGSNVYYDQECLQELIPVSVSVIIQGLYNSTLDKLNRGDSITINLRNGNSPYNILESKTVRLDSNNFKAIGVVNASSILSLSVAYLEIIHKNSIDTWSQQINVTGVDSILYNFTSDSSKAYGSNLIRVNDNPIRYGMYSGDVNKDDNIDLTDVINIQNDANVFASGNIVTDLNGDNFADLFDLIIAHNNAVAFVRVVKP